MENNEKTLSQIAWGQYKKNAPSYLALSFVLLLIGAAVFSIDIVLSYYGMSIAIFTIPFVLIPFAFAIQYTMTHVRTGKPLEGKMIGSGWVRYMNVGGPYFGVYRVITSFFKALLSYIAPYIFGALIYSMVKTATDPNFVTALNKAYEMMRDDSVTMEALYNYLVSTPSLLSMYVCGSACGMGVASYVFIRSIFVNSGATYVRGMMLGGRAPSRVGNGIFQYGFRNIRKKYYKEYYKAMWPFIPLLIVGFAVGYIIPCVIPVEFDITALPMFGFLGELILIAFFVPYAFEVQHVLTFSYAEEYQKASLDLAKMNLEQLKARKEMSEEQSKEIEEQLKEAEAKMKDALEKGEDPFIGPHPNKKEDDDNE